MFRNLIEEIRWFCEGRSKEQQHKGGEATAKLGSGKPTAGRAFFKTDKEWEVAKNRQKAAGAPGDKLAARERSSREGWSSKQSAFTSTLSGKAKAKYNP